MSADSGEGGSRKGQAQTEEEDDWLLNGLDATEDHGKFISHDDDYLEVPTAGRKTVAMMMEAQREILDEDDDGHIQGEFTGHEGATSEVYEDFKESAFAMEEIQYEEEYNDYTYDTSALYL